MDSKRSPLGLLNNQAVSRLIRRQSNNYLLA